MQDTKVTMKSTVTTTKKISATNVIVSIITFIIYMYI